MRVRYPEAVEIAFSLRAMFEAAAMKYPDEQLTAEGVWLVRQLFPANRRRLPREIPVMSMGDV